LLPAHQFPPNIGGNVSIFKTAGIVVGTVTTVSALALSFAYGLSVGLLTDDVAASF
jgi:hypothetical protein